MTSPQPSITRRSILLLLLLLVGAAAAPASSEAAPCTVPVVNEVACENTKPGADPASWNVWGAGEDTIQGFATSMSVNKGQTIGFKIKAPSQSYTIDILRIGYYGGDGARLIAGDLAPTGPSNQPACNTDDSSGLIDCGNWSVSRTWTVPSTAVSGVYIAYLELANGDSSRITFVVRDDASHSDVVVQTSDQTWQAYNTYGGNSLYTCTVACPAGFPKGYKGAYKVSYNRPLLTESDSPGSAFFNGAEYTMIRFLEANGYNASYISGVDSHRRGQLIKNHRLFISSGHDEYWSAEQRNFVEDARDAGVNLGFFSGNEMFWKTRFEPGSDGTADRTLVSYKDTKFPEQQDPVAWTGTWRDSRFTNPADDVTPENALTGQSFLVNTGQSDITVPYAYRQLRMWRNTAVASLTSGQSLRLAPGTLGYEWDVDADNGFRPAGQFRLSSTTVSGLEVFTDYGATTELGGTATHNLVMYRVPSGARVFGAGTVQWAWGLDDANPNNTPANATMRQATVNLFADMGAQPSTLLSGLVAATATTDTTRPTSTIDAPAATVADGTRVTLSGTATDAGGGVVGGVEVSTDNGSTWHPATGTSTWTYSWIAHGSPSTTIKTRATDDSGNIETPGAGRTVNVSCSCSIWGSNITPEIEDGGDPGAVEVGVKFKADVYGTITGIRFYKSALNTGTHSGSLWTADGERLAQATFTSETATGWQTATFATPVEVQPNTTYVASYHAPNGHYAVTPAYFYRTPAPGPNGGAIVDSPPLHAVRDVGTTRNGLYSYGAGSSFPVNSYEAGNYWVDVRFSPMPIPGQVTGVTATSGGRTSANVSWTAPASGGSPTSYEITPYVGAVAQTPRTVTGSPPATTKTITGLTTGTTYTFRVQAINPNGQGPESAPSAAVTPSVPVVPSAPTGVQARPASQSALVNWTAPENDGDSPITGQTVTPYIGADAQPSQQVGPSATNATITGLTNGASYTFRVSATNAVGTSGLSAASAAVKPAATIFDFATPGVVDSTDTSALEVGVKFRADHNGTVTGIRFYKAAANSGTHTGSLWTADGTRLAEATFTNETATGWQAVTFATPVPVTAGTTYVASYFTPTGHYSVDSQGLSSGATNPPLRALANSTSSNGVYAYGPTSRFPASSFGAANYWVDVMYTLPVPGQPTGVAATEGGNASANVTWTAPSSGGPVTGYKITPYVGTSARPATTVTGSPPATSATITGLTTGTTYTFTVQGLNASGAGVESAKSGAVTPTGPVAPTSPTNTRARPATKSARVTWDASASHGDSPITGQSVTPYIGANAQTPVAVAPDATSTTISGLDNGTSYTFRVTATNSVGTSSPSAASNAVTPQATIFDFAAPSNVDINDPGPLELGVKFRADFSGSVTGVRFYKSAANTGTHSGSLWTTSGQRLAQATFSDETASGWQAVTFDTPVPITADTTYIVSYFAPNGHYSTTSAGFASGPFENPPLRALANTTSANGVYAYGPASSFPSNSWGAANYWVDVLFAPAPPPGQVSGVNATAGQTSATISWSSPSTGGPVTSYEITPYIGSQAQSSKKTVTGTPPATNTTISGLTGGTAYTFTVRASNPTGSGPESANSAAVTPTAPAAPAAPHDVTAQPDAGSAKIAWSQSADGGSPITGHTVTPFVGSTAQTPVQVSGGASNARVTGLTRGVSYTFRVAATNAAGTSAASLPSDAVVPRAAIFDLASPAVTDAGDTSSVVVGVKFRSDVPGSITGLRFYKAQANTGAHIGSLWTENGTLLAERAFTGETESGWQVVEFANPVVIAADTTYVAAYLAPNGHYSVTGAAFSSSAFVNPPLRALASANGVYRYSATSAFPTSSWNSSNYWADVLFAPSS